MPPVDTALTECVHRPVSLSLVLTPVPPLVEGVSGNIKDEEEFLVCLEGGRDEKGIFSPNLKALGFRFSLGLG